MNDSQRFEMAHGVSSIKRRLHFEKQEIHMSACRYARRDGVRVDMARNQTRGRAEVAWDAKSQFEYLT